MDLGATICTPRNPACGLCPWRTSCAAHALGREKEFPVKAAKREKPTRYGHAYVARRPDGAILLRQRPPRGLLGGMAEVPGSEWGAVLTVPDLPLGGDWNSAGPTIEHVFTHFRLLLTVHRGEIAEEADAPEGYWWSPPDVIAGEALPSVMKKAIEAAYPGTTPAPRGGK